MGKRGILPSSSLYQQTAASDLLPVTTQYAGLTANTGLAEQKDLQDINSQIASLQAGNPGQSIQGATGYLSSLQNASNLAAQNQTALQQQALQQQYQNIPQGNTLYNTATNQGYTPGMPTGGASTYSGGAGQSTPAQTQLPPLTSFISSGGAAPVNNSSSQLTNPGASNNSLLNLFGMGGLNGQIKF